MNALLQRCSHLSRTTRDELFLLAVMTLLTLQMARALPLWAGAYALALLGWRAWISLRGKPLPRRWTVVALLLLGMAGAAWELVAQRSISGAALVFLLLLLALKTLELHARRDALVLFFLGFFCIVTTFLFAQTISVALLMLLVFWGLLTAVINAQKPVGRPPIGEAALAAARLVAIGLPLIAVLYVFFPRFPPLWGIPNAPVQGATGLSGSMEVGTIADLAQNRAIALRVQFAPDSPRPRQAQMYFRGPVLSRFDGRRWTAGDAYPLMPQAPAGSSQNPVVASGTPVRYEAIIEPHRQRWLLPLELLPAAIDDSMPNFLDQELVWHSVRPVNSALRYQAQAYLQSQVAAQAQPAQLRRYLQLPESGNARTRAWAQQLRASYAPGHGDRALAEHVLRTLHEQDYHYTLQPPLYGDDTADAFWFVHRAGFCEHIASAYAVLMRAAGIPARIVTGYQGGEANPYDGVWTVRQSDAHAWVEIWLPGEGWVRIDPTAAIAPQRINLTQSQALAQQGSDTRTGGYSGAFSWLAQYQAVRDAIDYRWTQWVLNYDQRNQHTLLQRLGLRSTSWLAIALAAVAVVGVTTLLFLLLPWLRSRRRDPWQRLLQDTRARLAAAGLPLPPHTPPRRMAQAADRFFGAAAADVSQWLIALDAQRYGAHADASVAALARRWRHLQWPGDAHPPK